MIRYFLSTFAMVPASNEVYTIVLTSIGVIYAGSSDPLQMVTQQKYNTEVTFEVDCH